MKKITFFLAATLGLVSFTAQAQSQATVKVRLYPIQSIVVNAGTYEVLLDYKNKDDYANGVSTDKADHLSVYSTGAFAVSVKANNATLESINPEISENIAVSDIFVTAKAGTTNSLAGVDYKKGGVSLTTDPQVLFSSAIGGVNKNFDVNYKAEGDANDYVNKYFDVESPTVYTTKVTYSIEAV